MADISKSPLYNEIMRVNKSKETRAHYGWMAEIHSKDEKGNDYTLKGMKVMGLTVYRDYVNNFADEITCQILIPLGKYARKIFPSRNDLEITLYKRMLEDSNSSAERNKHNNMVDRYTAILLNQDRAPLEGQGKEDSSEEALDHSGILQINFQVIPKTIEKIRVMQVGGVYGSSGLEDMMSSVITIATRDIKKDNKQSIESIDIQPVDNTKIKSQIVIPHGTKLIDYPGYLQSRVGVYNSGLGSYIQNKKWFIYYLYNTTKLKDRKDTVTFIILPKNKFPYIEKTYMEENGSTTILITGETSFSDDNGTKKINHGSGARFTDAGELMNKPVEIKDNKAVVNRSKLNNEFSIDKKARIANAPTTGNKITSNPHKHYSKLMKRDGGTFKAIWQTADLDLLLPGQYARILYDNNGVIEELNGILHKCEYMSVPMGGLTGIRYSNIGKLEFFVNKKGR